MSGGSYDYLYCIDATDLFDKKKTIEEMRDRLVQLECPAAAKQTEKLLELLERFEIILRARQESLEKMWQAVEWLDSGDWGPDQVKEEYDAFCR